MYTQSYTRVQTTCRGLLCGNLRAVNVNGEEHKVPIEAAASCVPEADICLFSVPMASRQGHSVVHEGLPTSVGHGMTLKGTLDWVPFIWDEGTGLWWIRVERDDNVEYGTRAYESSGGAGR